MADICVVYLSEDEPIVEQLVTLLRRDWNVWWARDIAHGDWEEVVRKEIPKSLALVPVLSWHTRGERKNILKDEMQLAKSHNKPILPFVIGPGEMPLGFGGLHYTKAHGWDGKETHRGYQHLRAKLAKTIENGRTSPRGIERAQQLVVRGKILQLPAFVFSLSSHETQVTPKEGAPLLHFLEPGAALVSAYDAWKYYSRDRLFNSSMTKIRESQDVLFLDSGNYEAYRKNDRYAPKKNPKGWHKDDFRETALKLKPDLAFTFDTINPKGKQDEIVSQVVATFQADDRAMSERDFSLCPIIHLPKRTRAQNAAGIVAGVARELDPLMLAIPERELGDGLLERARTVRDIRRALNRLGKYHPLHLLGTGNPLSMVALAAAGADSFDGLEWCRTIADYERGYLFHFQQFEFFSEIRLHRIQDPRIRNLVENKNGSYSLRALGFNIDFFKDWTRSMQNMIHGGQIEHLLTSVPYIGPQIFKELSE
jgi:hypothetical protein